VHLTKSTNSLNDKLLFIAYMDRDFRLLAAPSENPKVAVGANLSLNAKQQVQEEIKYKECNNDSPLSPNNLPSNKASKGGEGKGEAKKKWEILKRKASLNCLGFFVFFYLCLNF
jgi:hypothetical protein